MGYDPIIWAIRQISGERTPTYVDDLAALLSQAAQALRTSIFLPWASWVGGLHVAAHSCRFLYVPCPHSQSLGACRLLPVSTSTSADDALRIAVLTPELPSWFCVFFDICAAPTS